MTSVLLIRPLCEGDEPEFAEPLGIERLAGYLRAHGVPDVELFDRRLYQAERRAVTHRANIPALGFYDDLAQRYPAGNAPDIVGLSLMTAADTPDASRIITRLRHQWPHATFVAGGVFVNTAAHEAARVLPHHVVLLQGEGETQLLALARGTFDPAAPPAPTSPDIWAIPYRPHLERYARLRCAVNMQTSRGCPGSCAFCATPLAPPKLRRWTPRSIALVADEIQECAERLLCAGLPPIFNFVDDDFGPIGRLEELAGELLRRDLHVAFACEMRLASLAGQPQLQERLERLHAAGLTRVFVGVESLDPNTLASWRKPSAPLSELPRILAAFRSAGVTLACGYILWHAAQTPAGAQSEAARLRDLGLFSHRCALSRLIVFPGCPSAAGQPSVAGFEPMDSACEARYQAIAARMEPLVQPWLQAAIAEPYEEARAYLSGDTAELTAIRAQLDRINEASYTLFQEALS